MNPFLPDLPAGRRLPVVVAPDPVLSRPGAVVDPLDPAIAQLAADLIVTMDAEPGCVGLAACQVGVSARLFCLDVSDHPKTRSHHGRMVLANPVVEQASRNEKSREGCASVPELTGDVKRASRLTVRAVVPVTGVEVTIVTDAFEARALQHEIDHTDGFLFIDRVAGAHALHQRQTYL